MQGPDIEDLEMQGIIPRMVRTIFARIETAGEQMEFTVKISMIEIYMEKIRDLLDPSKDNLKVHEEKSKGVYVADVTETYVGDETEVYAVMRLGNSNRSIAATNMNAESSRSHSIFILTVTQTNMEDLSVKTGKLYLVDLAGSEKISKTGATGTTLDEAKMINKSLTTLGKVITALTDKKATHIPYRESKLTRIL
jgi:kinesin family protein 5